MTKNPIIIIFLLVLFVVLVGFGGKMIQSKPSELDIPRLELDNLSLRYTFTDFDLSGAHYNLFDKDTIIENRYIEESDGTLKVNATLNASDFMPMQPNTQYTLSGNSNTLITDRGACYDINEVYLYGITNINTFTTTSNTAYCKVTVHNNDLDTYQLEIGAIATAYQPHLCDYDLFNLEHDLIITEEQFLYYYALYLYYLDF